MNNNNSEAMKILLFLMFVFVSVICIVLSIRIFNLKNEKKQFESYVNICSMPELSKDDCMVLYGLMFDKMEP